MPRRHPPHVGQRAFQTSAAGKVVRLRKTAWRDGAAYLSLAHMQCMQRRLGVGSAEARFVSAVSAFGRDRLVAQGEMSRSRPSPTGLSPSDWC